MQFRSGAATSTYNISKNHTNGFSANTGLSWTGGGTRNGGGGMSRIPGGAPGGTPPIAAAVEDARPIIGAPEDSPIPVNNLSIFHICIHIKFKL